MNIDKNYLAGIGIQFATERETQAFARIVQSELEIRVGEEISRGIPDELLEEFDRMDDPDDIQEWLERNCPDYLRIVEDEIAKMERELIRNRSHIPGVIDSGDEE